MSPLTFEHAELMLSTIKLIEGQTLDLGEKIHPLVPFYPQSPLYIRQEMAQVFQELTKKDRRPKQILVGASGTGKSVLLFLVALYRALEGKPCCFVRKPSDSQELTSIYLLRKSGKRGLKVTFHQFIDADVSVKTIVTQIAQTIKPIDNVMKAILQDEILLFLDGLNESDCDLAHPHHYVAANGGYTVPVGVESASAALIVLNGWDKKDLGKAVNHLTKVALPDNIKRLLSSITNDSDLFADFLYYHVGGRVGEARLFLQNVEEWKSIWTSVMKQASSLPLSIYHTQLKNPAYNMYQEDNEYFHSALQLVDSHFCCRLLTSDSRQHYDAYMLASRNGLQGAASCHFKLLVEKLFLAKATSVGGVPTNQYELSESCWYCLPQSSASSMAYWYIDAFLLQGESVHETSVTFLHYVASADQTFSSAFLETCVESFKQRFKNLIDGPAKLRMKFIVPKELHEQFEIPDCLFMEGANAFVDCTSFEAAADSVNNFDFLSHAQDSLSRKRSRLS